MRNRKFIGIFLFIFMGIISFRSIVVRAEEIRFDFKKGYNIESESSNELDDEDLKITLDEFQTNIYFYKQYMQDKFKQKTKIIDGLEIIETDFEWNGDLELTNNPKTLVLHHIEASRPGKTIPVTDIHQWHLANGWAGIGYHFYITKTGKIYRGRPENAIGAHTRGFNKDSISIAVEGRYQIEDMPNIQKSVVEKLGGYLRGKYNIEDIKGHGELIPTSCPGSKYPLNSVKFNIRKYPIYIEPEAPSIGDKVAVQYVSHVQNEGWQEWKKNSELSGSVGLARRIEGIKISLANLPNSNIVYRSHIEDYGWSPWVKNGDMSGTKMEAKRIEAIQIQLEGYAKENYEIEYRVHVQDIGWMPWVRNGEVSGTEGLSKRVEGIEIRLVEKNKRVKYRTHIQDYGWGIWKKDGEISGTVGEEKRLEAIIINTNNEQFSDLDLKYRVHVQDYGWMPWVKEGEVAGTTNESKRIEAIQIEGNNKYQIEYRTHVQDIGWMPWVKNGQVSGTEGQAKRIEAIEIRIN